MVNPETVARNNFAGYVQSVAFQLSLSRRMIDLLQVVRDYGYPHQTKETAESYAEFKEWDSRCRTSNGAHQYISFMRALERRGLIIFNHTSDRERKQGDKRVWLSRAGELTCELLVESGLLAPAAIPQKKAGRK
jgi:hypothetical protein